MNRRGFLQSVLAAGGAIIVGPRLAGGSGPEPKAMPQEVEEFGLDIFSGSIPDSPEQSVTGTHLARVPLALKPSGKGVYLEAPASVIACGSGTPRYFRLTHRGDIAYQGSCGVDCWNELRFSTAIMAGGTVTIHDFTIQRI